MQNLNEALTDLRDTLANEGFTADLVAEVAEDHELNPVLLARKFEEKFGATPAAYQPPAEVELKMDWQKLYEDGMRRVWRSHPKMYWDDLTEAQKQMAREHLTRNIATAEKIRLIWK